MTQTRNVLLTGSLALWASVVSAQQTERYTLPAQHSAIYNLVGEIQVQAGTGSDVVVELTRGGRDASQLTVRQGGGGTSDNLRVIYPGGDIVYPRMSRGSNSSFQVADDGRFGDRKDGGRRGRRGHDWDQDQVTVRGSGSGLEAYADLKVSIPAGANLAIYLGVGKAMLTNVNGRIVVDAASAPVTAQGVKGALDVDVGSGSVTVTGAEAEVNIDTGSGDVHVTGVRGQDLTIDTGSGEVTASDLTVSRARVETGSGNLTLSNVRGASLHFDTGSGDIDVELATDVTDLSVETGSGDVVLRIPENLGATVDIETGSGGIQADLPIQVQRWSRDHVSGRLGNGEGRMDVETGSGDVKIIRVAAAAPAPGAR